MRVALMPTPGDPFLVRYWLKHAETWRDRVDRMIVCISWKQTPEVLERLASDIEALDAEMIAPDLEPDHGLAMKALLAAAPDGHIIYCEDDCYVRIPQAIDDIFSLLENNSHDIVGIPRGSMALPIYAAGRATGMPGPGLWPCMLAAHSDRFRAVRETFGTRTWEVGETVAGINYVIPEEYGDYGSGVNPEWCADTFGAAAMEMQVGARLHPLPELSVLGYHTTDAVYRGMEGGYVHIGSLSSGPWPERTGDLDLQHQTSYGSWAIRTGWWERYWKTWPGGLDDLHAEYGRHVERLLAKFGREYVDQWTTVSQSLVTWPE